MLNAEQEKAVHATEGRLLVLAGAGSGKTRVIVHRIAHLIQKKNVSPLAILGLTFTNKAASEMRERVCSFIGEDAAKQVTLATFHSFCMQVLRREIERLGYTRQFSLYDERDIERVITQLAREMLGHQGPLPSLTSTFAALREASCRGSDLESHTWHDQFTKDLYIRLQSTLRAHNAVSFDHLIHLTIRLFQEHPDVLAKYHNRYQYIMIDEYQDTNHSQFCLAELLAEKSQNLCVVGDDDQSIYGWRGAEVSHILHFKADQIIKLEQNYRSTATILAAANTLIGHNKGRHKKQLWSADASGSLIEVFNAPTDKEEALAVVNRILRLKERVGLRWQDIAILYRSNALSRQLEMALMQASWNHNNRWVRGIPYEVFGGLEFSERSEIKDLFSYLRVIVNEQDEAALLRIINVPRRGISDVFLDQLTQENRTKKIPLWSLLKEIAQGKIHYSSNPRAMSGISSFVNLIEAARNRFAEESLAESLIWFLEEVRYKRAIEEEVKSDKMRLFKWENVQECVNALAQYEQEGKENVSLHNFITDTALRTTTPHTDKKGSKNDAVQLMTLHSAKGLEFPACFIVGLEDTILPHEKSMQQTGVEEERRLFYVGITRARKFLTLSMARSRMKMGKIITTQPSRFLFELPKDVLHPTSYNTV